MAGPCGVTERLVVAMKLGNSGGAKGPQFKDNAGSGTGPKEIGDEPTNSTNGSEAAGGVACQSKGRSKLPLLLAVRQGVPRGRAVLSPASLSQQRRRTGSRWSDVRGHCAVRREAVARRIGGRTQ